MTTENGSRLDRIEKILEQNAERIAALAHEMGFLRAAVQGHIT